MPDKIMPSAPPSGDDNRPNASKPAASPTPSDPNAHANRRLGWGIGVSVIANVLLLQGAATLAKNNTLAAPVTPLPPAELTLTTATPSPSPSATPTPTPSPEATPTPDATPTPQATPESTPAPQPTPRPTPTPEVAAVPTPTPEPVPTPVPTPRIVRPIPTPAPVPTPVPTPAFQPTERTATPAPAAALNTSENTTTTRDIAAPTTAASVAPNAETRPDSLKVQNATSAAEAAAPATRNAGGSLRSASSSRAISGSTKRVLDALNNRNNGAGPSARPDFTVPENQAVGSKAAVVAPRAGGVSAADTVLAGGTVTARAGSAGEATPDVQSNDRSNTRQLRTVSGANVRLAGGNVLLTARGSSSAPSDFSVPDTSQNTLRVGTVVGRQGTSAGGSASSVATIGGVPTTQSNSGQEYVVNAPGATGRGVPGVARTSRSAPIGTTVSALTGRTGGGGGTGPSGSLTSGSGGGTGGSAIRGASVSARAGSGGGGNGSGVAIQGGGSPSARTGGVTGEFSTGGGGGGGNGRGTLAQSGSGGKSQAKGSGNGLGTLAGRQNGVGGASGSVEGIAGGSDGGVRGGSVTGRVGGGAAGSATIAGGGPGFQQGGGSNDGVEGGGGGAGRGSVKAAASSVSDPTGRTSSARNAEIVGAKAAPEVPDGMRSQSFSYRISVRVRIEASGRVTNSIASGSGVDAIDGAVLAAANRTRWRAAAIDGKPVTTEQTIIYNFSNK